MNQETKNKLPTLRVRFAEQVVPAAVALLYSLGVVYGAGLIPGWGRWFSPSLHYRQQVDALLRGDLYVRA